MFNKRLYYVCDTKSENIAGQPHESNLENIASKWEGMKANALMKPECNAADKRWRRVTLRCPPREKMLTGTWTRSLLKIGLKKVNEKWICHQLLVEKFPRENLPTFRKFESSAHLEKC